MQMASPRPPMPPVTNATRTIYFLLSQFAVGVQTSRGSTPNKICRSQFSCLFSGQGSGAFLDEAPGRRFGGRIVRVAQLHPRRHLLATAAPEPFDPVPPPTALVLHGGVQPFLRCGRG